MINYKDKFNDYKELCRKYCFVNGFGEIINKNGEFVFETVDIFIIGGCFDDSLVSEAVSEEFVCKVYKEGCYTFEAILSCTSEQRGDYPPPNLECAAYMEVEHIEYQFVSTIEEQRELEKEHKIETDKLPF